MPGLPRRRLLVAGAGVATTSLAGCSVLGGGGGDDDVTDRGPVTIDELRWIDGRPEGYDEYEPQTEATYSPDETIWLYLAVSDISGEPIEDADAAGATGEEQDATAADTSNGATDGSAPPEEPERFRIDLRQELFVTDPEDEVAVSLDETFDRTLTANQLDAFYVATQIVLLGSDPVGEYEATVAIEDRVSGTSDEAVGTFRIER